MPKKRRDIPWLDWVGDTAYVHWYDAASQRTKRLSLHTTDAVEAQKRYAAFLVEGHEVVSGSPRTGGLTVTQALDDYLREHVANKVVDWRRQEDAARHLKAFFGSTAIASVDIPACRSYAEARRLGATDRPKAERGRGRVGHSDSTIRRELVVLGAAARHAERWRRIGANATPPTGMPSIELPAEARTEKVKWLTKTELALALDKATGDLRDFIEVAYYTGARRASVERLTRFQVDLAAGRINLRGPDETANQRRSKKRRPVVPIDPKLRPTIERLMAANKDSEWLFGKPLNMYRPFKEHMTALALADKSNPHILRHSRATHLLLDGAKPYAVARLLGDTLATVDRVYGHAGVDELAEALEG